MPAATILNGDGPVNGHKQPVANSAPPRPLFTTTSYPSNCLQFLKSIEPLKRPQEVLQLATVRLNIIIVGAGLGGLAAAVALARRGHKVTVYEQAAALTEVGAGIQIPPNSGKLLNRWGVIEELDRHAVRPDGISFRRWQSGETIGFTDLSGSFAERCGAPYYVAHRAHLHRALQQRAESLGVDIIVKSRVTSYNPDTPSIAVDDGQSYQADLIVAADGIKSTARDYVSKGFNSEPKATNYAVYRATVDVVKMRDIPEVAWLLEKPGLHIWIGEDRHVMTYTIAAGTSFNLVLSHKDCRDPSTWAHMTQCEVLAEMTEQFKGWDQNLLKIIDLIDHASKWPLIGNNSLQSWVSPSSRLVVIGDAAHAMVPYMSQGAAMAVEDGAALATALNQIRSTDEVKFALKVFALERKSRASMMQEASMVNAMIWHFPDGREQEARDAAMRPEVEGRTFHTSPNQWSDPVTQSWAYGYDAEKVMEERWQSAVGDLIRRAGDDG